LTAYEADMLAGDKDKADFFEACAALAPQCAKVVCNWILGEFSKLMNERGCALSDIGVAPAALLKLIDLVNAGALSSTAAKSVFEELTKGETDPKAVMDRLGLAQISDNGALVKIVDEVLAENAGPVADFKGGKSNVLGFLVGICMKKSAGKGNPQIFRDMLEEKLK
ncbi:MAG: Asp-tRNA(Asn)/Glu-tRNA(Gln) amidotransferase GatCAB subunit B, partial [Clostridia bacterium]|nr:Asp-tRNA(Asn)/Glu-tRNA(Gln) amidotransferase GatCAB subunit B [Clostridia bacterium]